MYLMGKGNFFQVGWTVEKLKSIDTKKTCAEKIKLPNYKYIKFVC